jgi:exopolysaccharide production protein ExoQ
VPLASRLVREERSVRTAAFVLTVAALVALTSGPLYRVRSWWAFEDPLGTDVAVITVHAVFAGLAVARLLTGARWRGLDRSALLWAAALIGWLLITTLWSLDRGETLRQALQIASSLIVGSAAVCALGWRSFRAALWVALHVGLGWSVVAIYADRPGTLDENGEWAGVFFNRNSLALYAALGLLVSAFVAADALTRHRTSWTWPVTLAVAVAAVIDVRLIAGSGARTPLVALAAAGLALLAAAVGRRRVASGASPTRLAAWAGAAAVVVAAVAWAARSAWLDRLGRNSDLTGRSELWSVALDWAWRRPVTGFGYLGAWSDAEFLADVLAVRGRLLGSAHNSFVEVFLGAGLIGLVALTGFVVVLYLRCSVDALTGVPPGVLFPLAVFAFVLVENLTETLLVGNQLAVALLGTLVTVAAPAPARSPSVMVPSPR